MLVADIRLAALSWANRLFEAFQQTVSHMEQWNKLKRASFTQILSCRSNQAKINAK